MTADVRRKTATVEAGARADLSAAAGLAVSPARALRASRPARGAAAVRVLGTHQGRAMELLLETAPVGKGWLRYDDDQARQLVPLAEVRLTEVRRGSRMLGRLARGSNSDLTN